MIAETLSKLTFVVALTLALCITCDAASRDNFVGYVWGDDTLHETMQNDDGCVNDDTTKDQYSDTCTGWYDGHPAGCDMYNDRDFVASDQCCVCKKEKCTPACQNGGTCSNGKCVCTHDWEGPVCEASTIVPVNGQWGSWSAYGECSKKCGGGKQSRSRSCDNPAPSGGGSTCSGDSSEQQDCNTQECIGCQNDDTTRDTYWQTCTEWYDGHPAGCDMYNDHDFNASDQCCACKKKNKKR